MLELMEEKELYLAAFSDFEKALGNAASAWPHALRTAAIERFAEVGFPGPRDEDWKFTSLAALRDTPFKLAAPTDRIDPYEVRRLIGVTGPAPRLVFVNGRFVEDLSPLGGLPVGVTVVRLAEALASHRALV